MRLVILFITAYTAGSVNFSILLFKFLGKGDPRNYFSGNAGVTNVYRQAGLLPAAIVLVLDISRSMVIGLISLFVLPADFVPWCGLALILGNSFPCFHNFRGGKGIANYLGFTSMVSPVPALVSCIVWYPVYRLTKLPFVASFAMTFILAAGTVMTVGFHLIHAAGVVMTVLLILYNHKHNVHEFFDKRRKDQKKYRFTDI